MIRIPAPSSTDISNILKKISNKEGFILSSKNIELIINNSERNVRRAILLL